MILDAHATDVFKPTGRGWLSEPSLMFLATTNVRTQRSAEKALAWD